MYDPDKDAESEHWMGVQEAANFLGIHRATLFRALNNGLIVADNPTPRGRSRFRTETILAFQTTLRDQAATSQDHMYAPVRLMAKLANLLTVPGPSKDPQAVFDETVRMLCDADSHFDKACIIVRNPSATDPFAVRILAQLGIPDRLRAAYQCLRPCQEFPLTITLRTGESQICDDIRHAANEDSAVRVMKLNGIISYAVLPMVLGAGAERQTFGALIVCGHAAHRFSQQEQVYLQAVADTLSACITRGALPSDIAQAAETLSPEKALDVASELLETAYSQNQRSDALPSSVARVESLCDILVQRSHALATWVEGYPPQDCGAAACQVLEDKSLDGYRSYLKSLVGRTRTVGSPAREQWGDKDVKVTAVALPVPLPSGKLGAVGAVWPGVRTEIAAEGIVLNTLASACSLVAEYTPTRG